MKIPEEKEFSFAVGIMFILLQFEIKFCFIQVIVNKIVIDVAR